MTVVGRNDPCPCGSGKKYKRCHLDADRRRERAAAELATAMLFDTATVHLLSEMRKPGFTGEVIASAERLNAQVSAEIGGGLQGREAAEVLERYLETVEREIAEVAAKHSRGYWLYMTRRLPPQPLGGATDWTLRLYRRVVTLAGLKYGQPRVLEGEFKMVDTRVGQERIPVDLSHAALVDVFALEYLAFEYTTATQAYRRVGKGGHLVAIENDFFADADEELEALIRDLDRRVSSFGDLTGSYGAAADREFPMELNDDDAPLAILTAIPNTAAVPPDEALINKSVNLPGPPNFVPFPLVIDGYREALLPLASEVEAAIGVSPDVLLSVVWGLSVFLMRGIEEWAPTEVQLTKSGYLARRKGDDWDATVAEVSWRVAAWFEHFGLGRPDAAEARRLADEGLAALTYEEDDIASISLWDRLPFNFIIDADALWLIDYSTLPEMFADLFRQVGFLDGDPGNVKAKSFEAAVVARARREGFEPWKEAVELIHEDGMKKEIDAGFLIGDVLYVVECKAYAQNPKIDRGDWAARLTRQDQLTKYLTQASRLAAFIGEEPIGRNYSVPAQAKRIEPLLCTAGVEFIWSRDPELWLTDEIPRICTPDELMLVLKREADGL